jgi:exodeoxyribonuclease VII small subunit
MEEMKFEEALRKLEEIVEKLEKGDVELDDALTLYEEGKEYARFCRKKLNGVEERIKRLVKRDEEFELEDFEEPGGNR